MRHPATAFVVALPPHTVASQQQHGSRTSQQFPKSARLLRHADFERVYQNGRRHFAPHMTVFFLPRVTPEPDAAIGALPTRKRVAGVEPSGPRIGLTVGRVLGNAVMRNRIKRRVREAVRRNLHSFSSDIDVVINPKKSAAKAELPLLIAEVASAFLAVASGKGAAANERKSKERRKR